MVAVKHESDWIVCENSKIEREMEKAGAKAPEPIMSPEPYRG